jgi:predicted dehydrogenase
MTYEAALAPLRVGVIGAGYWGTKLIRVFNDACDMRVEAVWDLDPGRRAALAGVELAAGIEALLGRTDVDAVVVATPPSTHAELARAVLESGKHCWVEKPLAMRARDASALVEIARARGLTLFVDETFLYDPLLQQAKAWIEAGRLGRLYHLSFERLGMGRIRRDSDIWWNAAPHDLAILLHLVPGRVEGLQVKRFAYLQPQLADIAIATLRLSGGISAHIHVSWISPLKAASIVVVGSAGMLHFEGRFGQRRLRFFEYRVADPRAVTDNVVPVESFAVTETIGGGEEEPLALAAEAFIRSVRTGVAAPSAGEYSQRVVELLEAGARVPANRAS